MKYLNLSWGIIIFALCACINVNEKTTIIPLKMMDTVFTIKDRGEIRLDRFDYYLMKGYKDNKTNLAYIDNFARNNKDTGLQKYNDYHMIFYKESDETNVANIKKYIKTKGNYYQNLEDLIYTYQWYNGKFLVRYKYDNGKIIEPRSKVIIKNITLPTDSVKH